MKILLISVVWFDNNEPGSSWLTPTCHTCRISLAFAGKTLHINECNIFTNNSLSSYPKGVLYDEPLGWTLVYYYYFIFQFFFSQMCPTKGHILISNLRFEKPAYDYKMNWRITNQEAANWHPLVTLVKILLLLQVKHYTLMNLINLQIILFHHIPRSLYDEPLG